MDLKARALMFAKAISVWWGIYLIIGCCIGFCMKTLNGLLFNFEVSAELKMAFVIPCVAAGTLLLALISYSISNAVNRMPQKKLRKELDKACEKGISKEYISLLNSNCRGEMKSRICIEHAIADLLCCSTEGAEEKLERIDVVSILDVAHSTGNYYIPAYYYSACILLYLSLGENQNVDGAYESGYFYINSLSKDPFVTSVKAICHWYRNEPQESIEAIRRAYALLSKQKHKERYPLIRALILAIKAHILYDSGLLEEARESVLEAMDIKVSAEFDNYLIDLGRKIKNEIAEMSPAENTTL